MLPASWKPVPAGGLLRLGSPHDGGYVLSKKAVVASKLLLSFGLNDDWRFEKSFRGLSGARIVCFDHSVTLRFWALYTLKQAVRFRPMRSLRYLAYRAFFASPDVEHRRLKIGYDGPGEASLASLMREFKEDFIFLKADIEGSEYRILDDILASAGRFTGIVMELHDVDLHRPTIERFLEQLKGFQIVYLHANNFGGKDPGGDPLVLEISLMRSDLVEPPENAGSEGAKITPNDPNQPDIELRFDRGAQPLTARAD